MSLIKGQGTGEVSTGFYSNLLDQSIKFNEGDSSYLNRTIASAGSRTKSTFSCWFKLSGLSGSNDWSQTFYNQGNNSGSYHYLIGMYNNAIYVNDYDYGSGGSPGSAAILQTNRLFRDTSAWYHLVVRVDTTQATAANRVRVYVNNVDEGDTTAGGGGFSTQTINVSQNADMYVMNHTQSANGSTSLTPVRIGNWIANYNDGYIAEINYCDGQSLGPDSFGEFKQGIWTPKNTSGLTFGTNGFHLTFKDDVVSEGFNTATFTAKSSTAESVSGLGFAPDFVWTKARNTTQSHQLFDSVRGDNNILYTNLTNAESAQSAGYFTLENDGFSYGSSTFSANTYAAWCWEAGTSFSNDASATSVGNVDSEGKTNTAKGFSIIKWTYSTSADNLIAHGLGAVPTWILIKSRTTAYNWDVYHSGLSAASKRLILNSTGVEVAGFFDTTPTSTVFEYNTSAATNGDEMIAYCWTDVSGYSKFGSYTGSGSAGKQVTGLGFKPAWLMIKSTTVSGSNWAIWDNTRSVVDPRNDALVANGNDAEFVDNSSFSVDFLSDGFELNSNYGDVNQSSATYIYMAFADTREAAFFKDVTSNGNHFTPVNLDYRDSVPDVPTNNFATFNALNLPAAAVLSEGNTKFTQTSNDRAAIGNMAMSSGKWYYEVYYTAGTNPEAGLARVKDSFANSGATGSSDKFLYITNATSFRTPAWTSTDATGVSAQTSETILGFAIDADNGKAFISVNGTYINSGNPAAGSNPQATFDADWVTQTGGGVVPFIGVYTGTSGDVRINFGQDSSFAGVHATANSNADANGHGSFAYAPPSGSNNFLALCSQNLPDAAIIDGTEHFNTVTYTGDGASSKSITGVGFNAAPDLVWVKNRASAYDHALMDSVRGASAAYLSSNNTASESTYGNQYGDFTSFDSDGFTVAEGTDGTYPDAAFNQSSEAYVAWNWLAGSSTSTNGDGSVSSTVSVNTTAGFSIATFTGIATGGDRSFGHGLGKTPTMVIVRRREPGDFWWVWHTGLSHATDRYLKLNDTTAEVTGSGTWGGGITSSVVGLRGSSFSSGTSDTFVAYSFTDIEGYSKAGTYVGNGSTDGPFVHTGFRPAWIMVKRTSAAENWRIQDSKRLGYNPEGKEFYADLALGEASNAFDILSNGFKIRNTSNGYNASGSTYIYLAFADQPFKFSNAR